MVVFKRFGAMAAFKFKLLPLNPVELHEKRRSRVEPLKGVCDADARFPKNCSLVVACSGTVRPCSRPCPFSYRRLLW